MNSRVKIALATVWFGGWKGWINIYLESCARNPEITWFFLHDQPANPAHQPPNVKFVSTSLVDISERYERLTGRPITLLAPYKVCDLKPLLGSMFSELFEGYSWWGYCDNDLLWGDIRRFITDSDLARHDIISSHVCTIVGQFVIFRGLDLSRRLVSGIPEVDLLFADPQYRGIDELLIDRVACEYEERDEINVSRRMLQVWERIYEPSWENWASELESKRQGKPVEIRFLTGPCEWRDGRVFHEATGTETMFIHFLEWKRRWKCPLYPWPLPDLEKVRINERGLHFTFTRENALKNFIIRFRYEVPFRIACPLKHNFAKVSRAWSKILRAAGLITAY